jgi:hypothetical protein
MHTFAQNSKQLNKNTKMITTEQLKNLQEREQTLRGCL